MTKPLDRLTWPAHTDRLSFRPCRPADLPALFEIRSDPGVARFMPSQPSSYEDFVMRQGASHALDSCLIMELDGEVIGDLYLHVTDAWAQVEADEEQKKDAQAEIGWSLSPQQQGRGFATEAATEVVRICFEDLGVRRVTAMAFADNAGSLHVMEKLGMRREALHVAESLHRELGWVDSVIYALLRDEWEAERAG